jgi:flagellar biosynthesis/type III secretory pathway chaperone
LIADDKMTQVMNLFFSGIMSDKAFIEALQYVKLGKQYVLKTNKACNKERFHILNEYNLTEDEKKFIQVQNVNRRNQLNNLINQIQTKYRRTQDVKFFDEILEEWNK